MRDPHENDTAATAGRAGFLVLGPRVLLRRLEEPSVYLPAEDELFAVDEEAFRFLARCAESGGVPRTGVGADADFVETCLHEGILASSPVRSAPAPQHTAPPPLPSLRYLEAQITRRCNLSCRHCYLGKARPVDLAPDLFHGLVREFDRMQGLRILVSGGEPPCHPAFWEINAVLGETPLRSVLLSNGIGLEGVDLSRLAVDEVQVSLDGLRKAHETIRGTGTFDRVVGVVKNLREEGFAVSVATMAHRGNVDELEAMESFVRGLGALEWSVDVPCPGGRWKERDLTYEEAGRALSFGFGGSLHGSGGAGGTCGTHLMAVTPEGRGAKCGFYADRTVGGLEDGLANLWRRIPHAEIGELSCRACVHVDECRGGCRYRAEQDGDPLGPDPAKCAAYGLASPPSPAS